MTNEEPLVIVKARIDVVWEVVRENCGNSRGSVVRKGEVPLHRSGCGSVSERAFGTENRDVNCGWGSGVHWGSEVFVSRRGNENIVGVDGNVFMKCWSAYVQLQPGSLDSLILRQVVVKRLRIRANYQRVYIHRREV